MELFIPRNAKRVSLGSVLLMYIMSATAALAGVGCLSIHLVLMVEQNRFILICRLIPDPVLIRYVTACHLTVLSYISLIEVQ